MAPSTSATTGRAAASARVRGLLDDARKGSPAALGDLFDAVKSYLLLAANRDLPRSVRGKLGPSDIVQDALLAAHCGFESFQGGSPAEFFGWIRGILRHKLADNVRRYETTSARRVGRERSLSGIDVVDEGHPGWRSATPDSMAIRGEEAASLESALGLLPLDQRTVIWMRHWEGRSFAEIAAACDKSEAAVRKIWGRGFKRLKSVVEGHAARAAADEPAAT